MTKSAFEKLGYGKYDPKPTYTAHSLVKTKEGWVVISVIMRGQQADEVKTLCEPLPRALAIANYRIITAQYIIDQAAEGAV
jgi:hypothetical protein